MRFPCPGGKAIVALGGEMRQASSQASASGALYGAESNRDLLDRPAECGYVPADRVA